MKSYERNPFISLIVIMNLLLIGILFDLCWGELPCWFIIPLALAVFLLNMIFFKWDNFGILSFCCLIILMMTAGGDTILKSVITQTNFHNLLKVFVYIIFFLGFGAGLFLIPGSLMIFVKRSVEWVFHHIKAKIKQREEQYIGYAQYELREM